MLLYHIRGTPTKECSFNKNFLVVKIRFGDNGKVLELADGVYNGENDDGPKAGGRIVLVEPG